MGNEINSLAKKLALDFRKNWKTLRNPDGKEYVFVYGGNENLRNKFRSLFLGHLGRCDALVYTNLKKAGIGCSGEDKKSYYIDLGFLSKLHNDFI